MQYTAHKNQLEVFAALVSPIAQALRREKKDDFITDDPNLDTSIRTHDLQISISTKDAGDSSSLDSGGFFQASELNADTEPMSLPGLLQIRTRKFSEQPHINPAFEYLRQHILLVRSREFANLSPRSQALAKLGGLLHVHRQSFEQRTYHFLQNNVLIAVLDRPHHRFYVRREVAAMDYSEIHYLSRPDIAGAGSAEFEAMPVQDAVWTYAQHDPEALLDLPTDLGVSWLQLRRLPTVSTRLIADRQMQIIRKLLTRQLRFEQLRGKTSKNTQSALVSDLTCLYLTRSLTLLSDTQPNVTDQTLTMNAA